MKWSGPAVNLIQQSLSSRINFLDGDIQVSNPIDLPNEVRTLILDFLSLSDVFLLRCLSKRFYQISFLKKKMRYYSINSLKIFEVDEYYMFFH